jgi:hypothetical protein
MTGKFTKHQPLEKRKNFKGKPILIHKNFVRETENTKICSTRYCQPSETRKTRIIQTYRIEAWKTLNYNAFKTDILKTDKGQLSVLCRSPKHLK